MGQSPKINHLHIHTLFLWRTLTDTVRKQDALRRGRVQAGGWGGRVGAGGGDVVPKKRRRNSKTFPVLLPEMKDIPAQGEEPGREVGLGGMRCQ